MKKLLTVLGAAVAGFAAGILTAPKSGKETIEDIKRKAGEASKETEKRANQAKLAAQDSADSIKAGAQRVGDTAVETAREVKQKVEKRFK